MRTEPLLFAFVALTLGAAANVHAAPADHAPSGEATVSQRVPLGDLNLATESGARTALYRIQAAANHVCGGDGDSLDILRRGEHRACVTETTDQALARLASPTLTALRTGAQPTIRLAASH